MFLKPNKSCQCEESFMKMAFTEKQYFCLTRPGKVSLWLGVVKSGMVGFSSIAIIGQMNMGVANPPQSVLWDVVIAGVGEVKSKNAFSRNDQDTYRAQRLVLTWPGSEKERKNYSECVQLSPLHVVTK